MVKAIRGQEDDYYRDILIGLTLANFCAILMNLTMNGFGVETFWIMLGVSYAAAGLDHRPAAARARPQAL
jgi:hypothetical protein